MPGMDAVQSALELFNLGVPGIEKVQLRARRAEFRQPERNSPDPHSPDKRAAGRILGRQSQLIVPIHGPGQPQCGKPFFAVGKVQPYPHPSCAHALLSCRKAKGRAKPHNDKAKQFRLGAVRLQDRRFLQKTPLGGPGDSPANRPRPGHEPPDQAHEDLWP